MIGMPQGMTQGVEQEGGLMQKYRFPIDSKMEDSIIDADEAAAVEMLMMLHDFLIEQQEWQEGDSHLVEEDPEQSASQHLFQNSLPWVAMDLQQTSAPAWEQLQESGIRQPNNLLPQSIAHETQQSLQWMQYEPPCESQEGPSLGPSLEYDKQPRPTSWQPYTDVEFQQAAPRRYWKLGKLGRGPESDAEKVTNLSLLLSPFSDSR